jgi:hypothetical protein
MKPAVARRGAILAALLALGGWLLVHAPRGGPPAVRSHAAPTSRLEEPPPREERGAAPDRSGSISGTVRSSAGGAVGGGRVCANETTPDPAHAPRMACTDTSQDGAFSIVDLNPGNYSITAEADDFLPGSALEGAPLFVGAGENKEGIDIVLDPGGAKVSGVVQDATGGPVDGAWVRGSSLSPPLKTIMVPTDQDGRFHLWMPPGPVALAAEAVSYAPAEVRSIAPSGNVVLTLIPSSNIFGRVIDGNGSAVASAEVRAIPEGKWGSLSHAATASDAEGAFALRGLTPGRFHLVAEGDGRRGQSGTIEMGLAQSIDGIVVTVSSAASVSGHVAEGTGGQPCRQGTVSLGPAPADPSPYDPAVDADAIAPPAEGGIPPATSLVAGIDANGDVRFRAVPAGTYRVVVQCAEHQWIDGPRTIEVGTLDVAGLAWKVGRGLSMVVHVTDDADQPLANAAFRLLWPPRPGDGTRAAMALATDALGQSEVKGILRPGTYSLEPDGGYAGERVDVELRDGMDKVDATLRLAGHGGLLVTVTTSEGIPLDDVTVSVTSTGTSTGPNVTYPSGTALGLGHYRVAPLPPGRYAMRVSDQMNPGAGEVGTFDVDSRLVERSVVVDRGGRIGGRVVDGAGQPVPDTWVRGDCVGSAPQTRAETARLGRAPPYGMGTPTLSDVDGRFVITGFTSGALCFVQAEVPDGPSGVAPEVRVGDESVTVVLPADKPSEPEARLR